VRVVSTITVLVIFNIVFFSHCYADGNLQAGSQYKVINPVYLMATYNSLNNRILSKETARAYLHSTKYYKKAEVAFQLEVPTGTVITIISSAPKLWGIPFFADRYFVQLSPDLSRGLDVVLELNRGIEGTLDGLNPKLFSQL
jgi:hypothetical protein